MGGGDAILFKESCLTLCAQNYCFPLTPGEDFSAKEDRNFAGKLGPLEEIFFNSRCIVLYLTPLYSGM
jgi:hypothetical protein